MTHICIAIGHLNCGGAEKIATGLANHFVSQGHDVTVLTLLNGTPFYQLSSSVRLVQVDSKLHPKRSTVRWMGRLIRMRGKIAKINPDVVLSFMFPSFFLLAMIGVDIPVIISIRNNPKHLTFPETVFLRKLIYKRAVAIVAQTQYAMMELKSQTGHSSIRRIPNFVDINESAFGREQAREIISVGRLIESKGFDDLLEIFTELKNPGWRLRIVGDGPEKKVLELRAHELGIAEQVIFHGSSTDVPQLLRNASIFAFCSKSEGFPNALLEAMAIPLCCVSYDCNAGPSDIIQNGQNGFLVPVGDKASFARALRGLIENLEERKRIEREAKQASRRFSLEKIGNEYLNMLIGYSRIR